MNITSDKCYVLRNDVAIIDFDECALAFQATDRSLVEANNSANYILNQLSDRITLLQIAESMSSFYNISVSDAVDDVCMTIKYLEHMRIVKSVNRNLFSAGTIIMNSVHPIKYMANPDVSCRIEDEDGAIIYSPDTGAVKVIDPIGLELWETLSVPCSKEELVSHLKKMYADVPEGDVEQDVDNFLSQLLPGGFLGEVSGDLNAQK